MVAIAVDAVQIVAGLAAAGWSVDQIINSLKAKGEHQHAATFENLKAAAEPVSRAPSAEGGPAVANPLGDPHAGN
jgi:hypothetical protein